MISYILFIFHNITDNNTKWLECELSQTATFQDLIGYIHGICEDSDMLIEIMNQYVDRDNRRGSEKNDGCFTMEFNGSQWDMIKHLNKKKLNKLTNLNVLSLQSLFKRFTLVAKIVYCSFLNIVKLYENCYYILRKLT